MEHWCAGLCVFRLFSFMCNGSLLERKKVSLEGCVHGFGVFPGRLSGVSPMGLVVGGC